ncbi:MAG: hypothetical protein WD851_02390 [Pirellulales bacterium]
MAAKSRIAKPRSKTTAKAKRPVVQSHSGPLSVRGLREKLGVNRRLFSRVSGFSERAIADWEADKPLSEASLQRMRELSRLQRALSGIMKQEFVGQWLSTPNAAFDGLKPLEVIERGEMDRLWRMIYQLESGTPS